MISGVNHEPAALAHGYAPIGVRIRGGGSVDGLLPAQLAASAELAKNGAQPPLGEPP